MAAKVTQVVIDELTLLRKQGRQRSAAAVARVIQQLDTGADVHAVPVDIPVPDAIPGMHYLAAIPDDDPAAPVVIYRQTAPESNDYRVLTLFDRGQFRVYWHAEQQGLLDDPSAAAAMAAAEAAVGG
jgi:hypothetical protein